MHGVAKVRAVIVGSFVAAILLAPAVASAQSAFSGIVRDTSGAVLPGVTVEASSPVLIEKTRAAVTDGEGRYTIVDLRPGHLRRRLHADRLQHLPARRPRAAGQLHHARSTPTCASARSRSRSRSPATRRSSTCRARSARRC